MEILTIIGRKAAKTLCPLWGLGPPWFQLQVKELFFHQLFQLLHTAVFDGITGYENIVVARGKQRQNASAGLPQFSLHLVANNCLTDFFGNGKTDLAFSCLVGAVIQNKIFIFYCLAPLIGFFKVLSFAESIFFFQHIFNSPMQRLSRQYFATFGTASFQYIAAVFGSHTSSEAMYLFVYSSFWLISSFHFKICSFRKVKIIYLTAIIDFSPNYSHIIS